MLCRVGSHAALYRLFVRNLSTTCARGVSNVFADSNAELRAADWARSTAVGCIQLPPGRATTWSTSSDAPEVFAAARAAGMLGAKRVSALIPTHMPVALANVQVWVHPLHDAQDAHTPEHDSTPSPSYVPQHDDGGFSAESLLDPDVWMAQAPQAKERDAQIQTPPSAEPMSASLQIICRTVATSPTHTEALAGCMAACMTVCDAVHASCGLMPSINHVHVATT